MGATSPVLFIIFKRPDTTIRVFNAIKKAKPPKLYISANGSQKGDRIEAERCLETRNIVEAIDWDCKVYKLFRDEHLPVELSETLAIDWFFENETEGIILEDDCLPDMTFFQFCDELLQKYRDDSRIGTIAGPNTQFGNCRENYSYFFSRFNHSWGWATWRRVWVGYDLRMKLWPVFRDSGYLEDLFEDRNIIKFWYDTLERNYISPDTWDFQFSFHLFINNYLTIVPVTNLISNIGFGPQAEHTKETSVFDNMRILPLKFPLAHPQFMVVDKKADYFRAQRIFSFVPGNSHKGRLLGCVKKWYDFANKSNIIRS